MPTRATSIAIPVAALVLACGADAPSSTGGGGAGPSPTTPTWSADVAPIVAKRCLGCHVDGRIAPFPLDSYAAARERAGVIKASVLARTMPPFNLDDSGDCNTFTDARWLDDGEIATIAAWVDGGSPEGEPDAAPLPAPALPTLRHEDSTLDMGRSYTPPANVADEYRCFVVDPAITRDRFLTGYEAQPGDPRVVHHVLVFSLDSDEAEQQAAALAGPGDDGYTCFGSSRVDDSRLVAAWAPGAGAIQYPAGTGIRLGANRKAVMQVHYNMDNGVHSDRTRVALQFEDHVAKEATMSRVAATTIDLPPGRSLVTASGSATVPASLGAFTIYGVGPHMHTRGRTQDAWYRAPGGAKTCLSKVTNWDFHWQGYSSYSAPLTFEAGGTLGITCGYDTSDDDVAVHGGESTDDEMCLDFLYVTAG